MDLEPHELSLDAQDNLEPHESSFDAQDNLEPHEPSFAAQDRTRPTLPSEFSQRTSDVGIRIRASRGIFPVTASGIELRAK